MHYLQKCKTCGTVHRYYTKPWKSCRKILNITVDGVVEYCGKELMDWKESGLKRSYQPKTRRCSKCGKTGHNARTCSK